MGRLVELLVLGLACFRLSSLVAKEEGPYSLFLRLRSRLGAYDYDERGRVKTNLGRGISCPYCVGVYAAGLLWVLYRFKSVKPFISILAIAGIQAALQDQSGD